MSTASTGPRTRPPKLTIAITGAAGQLGTQIIRRLIDDRSIGKIIAIDLVVPSLIAPKLHYVNADVRDPQLARHFEGASALIHLAFIVTSHLERREFDDININGSENVFRAAASAGIKHILYASSVAAYGIDHGLPDPILEDAPRRLVDDFPYSAAKYRVEAFLDRFERDHPDTTITRIRPTVLVGARFNNPLGQIFARSLAGGLLFGASSEKLPVVWDEDVADAFLLALAKRAGGAFNVSAGDPITLEDLAKETGLRFVRMSGLGVRALPALSRLTARATGGAAVDPAWQRCAGVRVNPSSEKAKRELGWQPKHATALAVMQHYLKTAHGRTDPRIAAFLELAALGARYAPPDPEMTGMRSIVHLSITGRGGADYTFEVRDRRMHIRRGIPRPPTSIAQLDVETFKEMLAGRLTHGTAMVTGRIRYEGDSAGGFVLPALFTRFRAEAEKKGVRGRAIRTFARFLTEGART